MDKKDRETQGKMGRGNAWDEFRKRKVEKVHYSRKKKIRQRV